MCPVSMSQKSVKVHFLSLSLMPHMHSFGYWHFAKLYWNQTLSFFDTLKKLCLTSCGKNVVFFLLAVVLEVEKKHGVGGSLRHRALRCPQQLCATGSSHPSDVSSGTNRALLFCSEEKSTEGLAELPGSSDTDGWVTTTAGSQILQWQWAPASS